MHRTEGYWLEGDSSEWVSHLRPGLLRLLPSGSIDPNWTLPLVSEEIRSVARDSSNYYVGGQFKTLGGAQVNPLKFSHSGVIDTAWDPNPNGRVEVVRVDESNNSVWLGGSFTAVDGQARARLAEVGRSTGQPSAFNVSIDNDAVRSLVLDASNVYVGGGFTSVNGATRNRLVRLSRAGVLDSSFNPDPNGGIYALLPGPNGTLYAGGDFTSIGGLGRSGFSRLLQSNGQADPSWTTHPNRTGIRVIAPASNGVYIGGAFELMGVSARRNIARVSHTGTVDELFSPNSGEVIQTIHEQSNKVYAGGYINYYAATSQRQNGLLAFPLNASPVMTTLRNTRTCQRIPSPSSSTGLK